MRKTEADFERKAREEGWTVLKNGWPDYLLLREESGKLYGKGAEVKGIYRHFNSTTKQSLSKAQKAMFAALEKLGIKVDVVYQEAEQLTHASRAERFKRRQRKLKAIIALEPKSKRVMRDDRSLAYKKWSGRKAAAARWGKNFTEPEPQK